MLLIPNLLLKKIPFYVLNDCLTRQLNITDVLLLFKDCKFLLHSSVIEKSEVLRNILHRDEDDFLFNSQLAEAIDTFIQNSNFYSDEYKKLTKSWLF